jgi:hypothetical protein
MMFKAMMGLFVLLAIGGVFGAGSLAGKWSLLDDAQVKSQNDLVKMEHEKRMMEKGE